MKDVMVLIKRKDKVLCFTHENGNSEPRIPFLTTEDPPEDIKKYLLEKGYKIGYIRHHGNIKGYEIWKGNAWDLENPSGHWLSPEEAAGVLAEEIKEAMKTI